MLDNHNYSFYTGNMGKIFSDWHDKKIDGTKAVQMLKRWYDKGIRKVKSEKYADIEKKELKRCFDSLASFIRNYDLVNEEETPYNNQEPKQHIQNELVPKMIEKGILSKNGKTPLKNLDLVACFLVDEKQSPTVTTLLDLELIKRDGNPYSLRACHKAINVAYTKPYSRRKNT